MFVFVILHYKNIVDTIKCLESIKKIDNQEKIRIVVVDNHTLDETDIRKIEKYTKDIVLLDDNLGFAKANNIGCKYAIENYNPDFMAVINSDTEICQSNFINMIYEIDNKYHYDVLGPKILPDELDSCNPFPAYTTLNEVEDRIVYTKRLIKIYKNPFLRYLLKIYTSRRKKKVPLTNGKEISWNVPLHGCALVFSKKYYEKYSDVFYNKTFLFHEEEFLYQRCVRDRLLFLYNPELEIIHKEGQSLNMKFKNDEYRKLLFRNTEILKSLELLKEVMKNNKEV